MSRITLPVVVHMTRPFVIVGDKDDMMLGTYQIYVKGRLGPETVHLLADLDPDIRDHSTVLHTEDTDQASLHGTLARLRDLGLEIDSVWKTEPDATSG
jgi:hypothetical protein